MNIAKIIGLSHTCPTCHTDFVRMDMLKGLFFCPHCHQHLRFMPKAKKSERDDWSFTKRLAASAALAAVMTAFIFLVDDIALIHLFAEIVGRTMIAAFILLGVICVGLAIWGNSRLLLDKTVECGVDRFDVIKQERCPEYKLFIPSASRQHQWAACPACQSVRLADRYWYKTCWGAQGHSIDPIPDIDDHKFYGCLNCGKRFERVELKDTTDHISVFRVILLLGLIGCFVYLMVIYPDLLHVLASYKTIFVFIALLGHGMVVVFPRRQTPNIHVDSVLQELA